MNSNIPAPVSLILSAIVPALLVRNARSAVSTVAVLEVNTAIILAPDCTVDTQFVAYDLKDIQAPLLAVAELVLIT